MFKYICLIWSKGNPEQAARARNLMQKVEASNEKWRLVFEEPGVSVYNTMGDWSWASARPIPGKRGVVLGSLFERAHALVGTAHRSAPPIDEHSAFRIIESGGRSLVEDFWGNYVAVLHDSRRARINVLRGPASLMPCMYTRENGVHILFSHMADCEAVSSREYTIDWEYLKLDAVAPVPTKRTGLREISQLKPGECLEFSEERVLTHVYWDPFAVSRDKALEDPEEAGEALRRSVKACVHTWASQHAKVVLSLSGGLDSSIVLSCLRDAPTQPQVVCVTQHSPGPEDDERVYARVAATAARCELVEQQRDRSVCLSSMLRAAPSAFPQAVYRRTLATRSDIELARARGATAIFSGVCGDQIFFQSDALLTVADFLYRHGVQRRLGRIAYNAAQLEGFSIWRILRQSVSLALSPRKFNPVSDALPYATLVKPEVIGSVGADGAAMWGSPRQVPPGKLWHVYASSALTDYYDPLGQPGDPELVSPLISQPIIETALRIPTYNLMIGGWDRGLARRSFACELPPEIVRRRSKGGMADHTLDVIRSNLAFMREMLLNGILVKHGVLDPTKLAEALSDRPSNVLKGLAAISHHLDTEVWLRSRLRINQRAA